MHLPLSPHTVHVSATLLWPPGKAPHCLKTSVRRIYNVIYRYKGLSCLNSALCSHLSAGQCVSGQFDFGEVALADGLQQAVVADVRLLVCDGRHRAATWRQTVAARRFGGRGRRLGEAV